MTDKNTDLQLHIEGRPTQHGVGPIRVRTFTRAAGLLTDLLSQLAQDREVGSDVDWVITDIRQGSAVLDFGVITDKDAGLLIGRQLTEAAGEALAAFEIAEERTAIKPRLSYAAVEKIRQLGSLGSRSEETITVRTTRNTVALTGTSAARARALLDQRYRSLGSVEGWLETISVHGDSPSFVIYHALNGYAVKCLCDITLLEELKPLLGRRIRAKGAIERRFDGKVDTLEATDYHLVPLESELPSINEVFGILAPGANELTTTTGETAVDG